MRQKTEEEGEVSHLNDSPIMDLSEQEVLGRTDIEKNIAKCLNSTDIKYGRIMLEKSFSSPSEFD